MLQCLPVIIFFFNNHLLYFEEIKMALYVVKIKISDIGTLNLQDYFWNQNVTVNNDWLSFDSFCNLIFILLKTVVSRSRSINMNELLLLKQDCIYCTQNFTEMGDNCNIDVYVTKPHWKLMWPLMPLSP